MKSIDPIIKFLSEFTFKKFISLVTILVLGVLLVWMYESQTEHFALSSASSKVDVLTKLVELREEHTLTTDEEKVRSILLSKLDIGASSWSPSFKYNFTLDRFLYGLIPWGLFSLFLIFSSDEKGKLSGFFVCWFLAILFALIACLFNFDSFWIKLIVVPWGLMIGVVGLIAGIAVAFSKKEISEDSATQ